MSRSFTTSQVTRNELKDGASSAAPGDTPIDPLSENQKVVDVDGASSAASGDAPSNTTSARNELEDGASSAASVDAPTNTVSANEVEDGASSAAPEDAPTNTVSASNDASSAVLEDAPSNTIFVGNVAYIATEEDLKNTFAKFGEVIRAKIRAFFFPDPFFSTVFFLRITPLDISQNFRPRGTCHIDFANKESAVATMKWTAQNSLNLYGRKLRVEYSLGDSREPPRDPNFSLHFSGCTGEESEVRNIFQQFSDSIVDIFLSMLFILSDPVPTTE